MKKHKRTDSPDETVSDLLNGGWVFIDEKYHNLVEGVLRVVRSNLDRVYWNKNQSEMSSPFDNTGAPDFVTDYLTIRSYNWDENNLPNLDTDKLKVFWYKHSGRGVEAMVKESDLSDLANILADVVNQAVESIDCAF